MAEEGETPPRKSAAAMLAEPFPQESVSWRAGAMTRDGKKAMALAYIDARDVMRRLDEVFGIAGWQCRYERLGDVTVCSIGVWFRADGEPEKTWIWKADGAGDTDFEAEKGALSDAFKRAAVRWGIGRYLYDLPSPWVPCESYQNSAGKTQWRRWSADPWLFINPPAPTINGAVAEPRSDEPWVDTPRHPENVNEWKAWEQDFRKSVIACNSLQALTATINANKPILESCRPRYSALYRELRDAYVARKAEIMRQGVIDNG